MGDLIIISPWDIQDDEADIIYRYRRNQIRFLSRRNILPNVLNSLI
jgi:initiation factor 1A